MLAFFRKMFARAEDPWPLPCIPAGERVYAVGDIHGRLDLFRALLAAIEADDAAQPSADTTIILLGDLVDRGPDSSGVLRAARLLQRRRKTRILYGNHEEMFVKSMEDVGVLRHFLRHGGRETLASYGIRLDDLAEPTYEVLQVQMADAVPPADLDFIATFEEAIAIGDYLFVHAGVDPAVALDEQDPRDLRWIREPFMSHPMRLGPMIVHGHTIVEGVEERAHRISLDTGAYMSGRLTAVALEGESRRYIEARQGPDGEITVSPVVPGGL